MVTYPAGIRVEIGLTDTDLKSLSVHINNPLDYARLVIASARFFLNNANRPRQVNKKKHTGRFVIRQYTKSRSRVFIYHQTQKYVSFIFPFRIKEISTPAIDCEGWMVDISSLIILDSIIEELCDRDGKPKKGPQRLPLTLAEVAERLINNSVPPTQISMHDISVLSYILTSEPGYIRYDHDPNNARGQIHPRHHIDINYSQRATYKYGLYDNIDFDKFESIFDKDIEKQYLHPYHKLLEPIKIGSSSSKLKIKGKRKKYFGKTGRQNH